MELPNYVEYAGPSLTLDPPFQFTDVTTVVFPLRAELDTLQRFVDSYINIVPPEVAHFRVPTPYVHLMLLDYGKLSNQSTNFGCFSQREVLFFISLEWYKRVDGRLVFQDWASVTPFIYVDGEISLTLGRTAMGWPKSIIRVTPEQTGWLQNPEGLITDVEISAKVFPKVYGGVRMEERPVVSVRSDLWSTVRVPFDVDGPMMPWTVWGNVARGVTELSQDYFSSLRATGVFPPSEISTPENFARKLDRTTGGSRGLPWAPDLTFNSINLKQFRRADEPSAPCYQALTRGPLRYTAFVRGGLLGGQVADVGGGYMVDLACWPTFPVVETLGIRATKMGSEGGPKTARTYPVFPFWYNVNMAYERTETLACRGRDGTWRDPGGEPVPAQKESKRVYFDTAIGAASPVVTGPFTFTSATIRVFSLKASLACLQKYVDAILNKPLGHEGGPFKVWTGKGSGRRGSKRDARVYLTLVDWGDVVSQTNSIGNWADQSLTFYIPVERFVGRRSAGVGLLPAYSFANSTIHTCTLTELYGVPTTPGTFDDAKVNLDDLERREAFSLVELRVESLPALHEGQMVRDEVLLQVLETKHARRRSSLGAAHADLGRGIDVYTLKQFRDVSDPEKACYQAHVRVPYRLLKVHEAREVMRHATLNVRYQAMYPIAKKLGLGLGEHARAAAKCDEQERDDPTICTIERWVVVRADVWLGNGEVLQHRTDRGWRHERASKPPPSRTPAQNRLISTGPEVVLSKFLATYP